MLISCNRLKHYVTNSDKIDWLNIWSKFTIRCAEIEGVKEVGNTFDGVVVAEIKECAEHPNSDHMHILKVDAGEKELTQVVCGAPNVRVGLKTAFVKVGGHIDGYEITARPLRGVDSFGMCCSGKELQISDNHEGILELPNEWKNGTDIKELLPIEDIIVEIDNKSLTNRPDLWGHYGIAREIAALTGNELIPLDVEEVKNDKEDLSIVIKDANLCRRYCGLKIENITNNTTPFEMQIFLYYVGMRSISLLVDLTNFLMLELGQPMHAFDARVVKNIEVGVAKDGDTYTTLDGVERKLTSNDLMIKNGDQYFCIAGVMGGLDSEILPDTTSVFLESANFDAGSIRKTAVALGLRTEASARYEKSLDPNMTIIALKRLVYLLRCENPDMKIVSNLTDVYPNKLEECEIELTKQKLAVYMGKELEDKEVEKILESLGFGVKTTAKSYKVTVPTFRHSKDINIPEDLIEEIARMHGFENIEETSLNLSLYSKEVEDIFTQEYQVKSLLATKFNLHEVHSYVWYDTEMLKAVGIEKDGVKLIGKTENNVLRDDLSFSLLNIVNANFKNMNKFGLFEIGTTIENKTENHRHLSILLCDEDKNVEENYNLAKSIVAVLFKQLKNVDIKLETTETGKEYYERLYCKNIIANDKKYGEINIFTNKIITKLSKKKIVISIEIDFDLWVELNKETILEKEVSKYPTVNLDYTIILNKEQKYEDLDKVISAFNSKLINSYSLVSIYENKYTIRFNVGKLDRTLDTDDLSKFKERFIEHIKDNGLNIIE